jgi:hypothetical protein
LIASLTVSTFLKCTQYGCLARISYFGATMTEYEKKRDVFLHIYITGVSLIFHNEKVNGIRLILVRKACQKVFIAPQQTEPVTPHAPEKSFDLRNSDPFTLQESTSFLSPFLPCISPA